MFITEGATYVSRTNPDITAKVVRFTNKGIDVVYDVYSEGKKFVQCQNSVNAFSRIYK